MLALSFLPVLLWAIEAPLPLRFKNITYSASSLGDIAGLVGYAMFAIVLMLSARLKFFENFFLGINKSYTAHHILGGVAFCLLLFHPLLLAYNYLLVSFRSAAMFLLPSSYWAQNLGIFSLFLMILTLCITFYTNLKYQVWKFTHKFMGLAFILAFLHVFLIGSDVASNTVLKIYLLVLSVLAITTYFYRTLFADYLVRVFDYKVKNLQAFPDKIWEIEFEPAAGRRMKFSPGQFAFVRFFSSSLSKEAHPFSFSSSPDGSLKIAIKELGDYTSKISQLKAGDKAEFEGPFGAFSFKSFQNKNQVWIAGGVGITPFLSMLRELNEHPGDYKIDLYFSVKNREALAFKDEIEEIAQKNDNLKAVFWITDIDGLITADEIKKITKDIAEREILICGPNQMMSSLKSQFLEDGFKKSQIHTEEFMMY